MMRRILQGAVLSLILCAALALFYRRELTLR